MPRPKLPVLDVVPPKPRRALLERSADIAILGMFLFLAALGLLLFLPRSAPVLRRHAAVEQLFVSPKIALRAETLGRAPVDEARR